MPDIHWIFARLRRMSPPEVSWRIKQYMRAKKDALLPRKLTTARKATEILDILPPVSHPMPITYFNAHREWKGEEIPWQDPIAMSAEARFHWSNINYRDTNQHGDPKIVWELSRHQFLRHWVLRDNIDLPTRVNAVSHLILNWIEKNPVGYGLNWCSSLEVALRLVSWETAVETLGDENFNVRVMRVIHRSTVEHAAHLRRFPSLFSSDNNHRIGELLGEMAAAALFPDEDLLTAAWNAWYAIQAEAALQVSPDGVNREQATYYHAYVMLFLRRATRYAEQLAFPVPVEFRKLLESMQSFLNSATDDNGNWFEIGDRDDGDLHALLPWMIRQEDISFPASEGTYFYRQGGYVIWKQKEMHALFRCGQFGYPSIAAHAHADQLSFLLKFNNDDLLTDSGTCSYHDQEKWRRYFRSTAAHNTVRISGVDQAQYGGPFLWQTAPEGKLETSLDPKSISGTVSYAIPEGDVKHQRSVICNEVSNHIVTIIDEVTTSGPTVSEVIWNLGPAFSAELEPVTDTNPMNFSFKVLKSSVLQYRLKITASAPGHPQIYHGDESVPAGFYSRKFGERIAITQIRVKCRGSHVKFQTDLEKVTQS